MSKIVYAKIDTNKLADEIIERLMTLYVRYFNSCMANSKIRELNLCKIVHHEMIKLTHESLSHLKLDYDIQTIEKMFDTYGVIVLRKPTISKKLIISEIFDEKFATMYPTLRSNPTIVGCYNIDNINSLLKKFAHQYDKVEEFNLC